MFSDEKATPVRQSPDIPFELNERGRGTEWKFYFRWCVTSRFVSVSFRTTLVRSQGNVDVFNLMGVFRQSCCEVSRRGTREVSSRGRGGGSLMDNAGALSRECDPVYLMGVFRQSCCDVSCRGSCEVSSRGERGVTHGQHWYTSKGIWSCLPDGCLKTELL